MTEQDHFTSFRKVGTGIAAGILRHYAGFHRVSKGKGSRRIALNQTIRHQDYVDGFRHRIGQLKLGCANGVGALARSGLVCGAWLRSIASRERDTNQLPTQRMPTLTVKERNLKVSGVTNLAEAEQ